MSAVALLENIIREAMREAECVALFTICLLLLFILHWSNLNKLDNIRRDLENGRNDRDKD